MRGLSLAVAAALVLAGPLAAQFVDPSGEWRTLHTPHFRVHFRPEYRAAAHHAAREAERAYRLLATELHPPRGTVDVTLADDADLVNGFASIVPSNRLTLFLAPPTTEPALQHHDDWLRLVTVHELTHVFHLDRTRGFWGVLQTVFGRVPGLFPNAYQPSWVTEGIATYYESRFTAGGRLGGSYHAQLLGADVAGGAPRSPWDALFFTRWPDGNTPYAYGSTALGDLARGAGDSVVPRFVEATAKQTIPFRVGRQLGRVGATDDLGVTWHRAVREAAVEGAGAPETEIVLRGLWADPVPAASADGRRVAYVRHDGRGAQRLVVADGATLVPLRSRRVNRSVSLAWAGDTLLLAQLDFTDRWRLRSDLYRWEPDGAWRRVTDGARIVEAHAGGGAATWLVLGAGDNRPALPAPEGPGVTWGAVAPSPDGRWAAAARHADGYWSLVRWPRAAPESLETLLATPDVVADVLWQPDGQLLFVWDVSGLPQVYRWSDGGAVPVTAARHGARSPALLADGSILYASFAAGGWTLERGRPIAGDPVAPRAPVAFDSAPPVPVRETGYSAFPSLWPRFWIPLFLDAQQAGLFLGAVTSGSDAVGRYGYFAQGFFAWDRPRVMGAAAVVTHALGNPSIDVGTSSEWRPSRSFSDVSFLDLDAWIGATFETRRWRSVGTLRVAAEYEGIRVVADDGRPIPGDDLVGGSVALGLAHAVAAPLAISPQRGIAWSVLYRRREAQGRAAWSDEGRTRVALYLPLPRVGMFANPVLAVRGAAGASQGPLGPRFDVGGVPTADFDLLTGSVVGGPRTFFIRGHPVGARRGSRAVGASAELRVPLALVGRSLGRLPFGADMLSLSLFADAGDAWKPGESWRLTRLRSVGAELVGDITVNYDAHLRVRLGLAAPLPGGGAQGYLALGSAF